GGAGDDAVLGDDGRIFTSRNGLAEPLNGVSAIAAADLNKLISSAGNIQTAFINISGALKRTVDLTPFSVDTTWNATTDERAFKGFNDDIIYGGLGNDVVHGGSGDDAISGGEALVESYTQAQNANLDLT